MKEEFNLSDEIYYENYIKFNGKGQLLAEDVKEFIRRLKEDLMTDDISIYDYQNQPNVQKAVEEQITRIMNAINKLAGKKLI